MTINRQEIKKHSRNMGGINNPMYGKHHSKEFKIKRSDALKGDKNPMYNKHHSKETREKMRNLALIPKRIAISINNLPKDNKGKKHTEESKKKMSESSKNPNGLTREKMREHHWSKTKIIQPPMKGKNHSNESKIKMKIKRALRVLPKKDTKIEIKIRNFLDLLKIEYFQHKYMNIKNSYQCDFFIPSMNLVIECDGTYWHKYPTGRDIDHIRTKELLEKGFKVLRLWEFEINNMTIKDFQNKLNLKEKDGF